MAQYEGPGEKISPPTPAPKVDYSTKSDLDIVGYDPKGPELGDQPKSETPVKAAPEPKEAPKEGERVQVDEENRVVEPTVAKPEEKEKPAESEKEPDAEPVVGEIEITPELSAHFQDPKVGKELRQAVYGYNAYKELWPDIDIARTVHEHFPTAESLETATEELSNFGEMRALFNDNPDQFIRTLAEEDKPNFRGMVEALHNAHHELDPDHFAKLERERFKEVLGILAGREDLTENQQAALEVVSLMAFRKPLQDTINGKADPRDEEIERLRSERSREHSQAYKAEIEAFRGEVDEIGGAKLREQVQDLVEGIVGKNNGAVSAEARAEISDKVFRKVVSSLRSSRPLKISLDSAISRGNLDDKHFTDVINLILVRGNQLARSAAREIIPEYTQKVLGLHDEQTQKLKAQGSRRDVGFGGSGPRLPGSSSEPVSPQQIDYRNTTDEDILEGRLVLRPPGRR